MGELLAPELMDVRPTPVADIDKLMGAVQHELGHIVAFGRAGLKMTIVEVRRRWFSELGSEGATWTSDPILDNLEQVDAFCVGLMAGMEAHRLWLMREHNWEPKQATAFASLGGGGDRPMFQAFTRFYTEQTGRQALTMPIARQRARVLVAQEWFRIQRMAPVLRRHREMKIEKLVKKENLATPSQTRDTRDMLQKLSRLPVTGGVTA